MSAETALRLEPVMAEPEAFATHPLSCGSFNPTSERVASACDEEIPPQMSQNNNSTERTHSYRSITLRSLLIRMLTRAKDISTSPYGLQDKWKTRIATLVAIAGFIIACLALWSTISATNDGRKAKILAEWTAKKDFLEYCQMVNYTTPACEPAMTITLDPPPIFSKRGWSHSHHIDDGIHLLHLVPLLIVSICCLWVGFRRRIMLCAKLTRRIRSKPAYIDARRSVERRHRDSGTPLSYENPVIFGNSSDFRFEFKHSLPTASLTSGLDLSTEHAPSRRRAVTKKAPRSFNGSDLEKTRVLRKHGISPSPEQPFNRVVDDDNSFPTIHKSHENPTTYGLRSMDHFRHSDNRIDSSTLSKLSRPNLRPIISANVNDLPPSSPDHTHCLASSLPCRTKQQPFLENTDFPINTSRMRTLDIEDPLKDAWREQKRGREFERPRAGQKHRASSPPDNIFPLVGDVLRRRDGLAITRGSLKPQLSVIDGRSISSISLPRRIGSYTTDLTASSIKSIGSFGHGLSPARLVPSYNLHATPLTVMTSPRSGLSRSIALHPSQHGALTEQTVTGQGRLISPRKSAETPEETQEVDTEEELKIHAAKQYGCSFCGTHSENMNEAERHQNSHYVRRHSWSCSALKSYDRAFHDSTTKPGEVDACGFCGEEFPRSGCKAAEGFVTDYDWEERIRHLQNVHKFRECNASKKFYRAEHFRQHLKHSHAGYSGKWINMLEEACMIEEDPRKGGTGSLDNRENALNTAS